MSSLCAFWIIEDTKFLHADNEQSDQTAWMRRLICVFVGRTYLKVQFLQRPLFSKTSVTKEFVKL